MVPRLLKMLCLISGLSLLAISMPLAAESAASAQDTTTVSSAKTDPKPDKGQRLPGVSLAEGVSQITGTAVSPLLGVSALGAWKYYHTPEQQRHLLPWYCHYLFWGPCFALLGGIFLKDLMGTAVPGILKKPLDFLELFEDKISALIASGAFVPLVAAAIAEAESAGRGSTTAALSLLGGSGLASVPVIGALGSYIAWFAVLTPIFIGVFLVVWLMCHSINVLIAMSPFGLVDAVLKLIKAGLLLLITATSYINPWLGLLICVPVIIVAILVSGWAFRLTAFGAIFGWDILSRKKVSSEEVGAEIRAFNLRPLGKAPVRSYGEVVLDDSGAMLFRHRPWLVMPARVERVEPALNLLSRGLLYPTVHHVHAERGKSPTVLIIMPRYRACVPHLGTKLGITQVTDGSILRGLQAIRQWFRDILALGRPMEGKPVE